MHGLLITVEEFRDRTVNDIDGLVSSLKDLTGRGGEEAYAYGSRSRRRTDPNRRASGGHGHAHERQGGAQVGAQDGDEATKEAWFIGEIRNELRRRLSETDAAAYEAAGRFDLNWRGLARYWRKKTA